ncbi:MAG: hypothetical protein ACYC5O_06195, partial [Anaerolineae bacterium]
MSPAAPRGAWCDVCGAALPKNGGPCPGCGNTAELAELLPNARLPEPPAPTTPDATVEKHSGRRPRPLHVVLAFAGLILFLVAAGAFGVYSGLQERERREVAEAATHYQRGLDSLAAGDYALAVAEFEYVERVRPGYEDTGDLLARAREHMIAQPSPTSQAREDIAAGLLARAQDEMEREAWNEAIKTLQDLQDTAPGYQTEQVRTFLFQCMYNAGQQALENVDVTAALEWFKQARELNPQSADAIQQVAYASAYLDALDHWGNDWPEVIRQLDALYATAPEYVDVLEQLATAYSRFGDQLSSEAQWCEAMAQYDQSLDLVTSASVSTKQGLATDYCLAPPATATPEVTGTPDASGTPSPSQLPGTAALYFSMGDGSIYVLEPGSSAPPQLLITKGDQPAIRADGSIAYRNLAPDQLGISMAGIDGSLIARISRYAEDSQPTWEAGNARVAFASTRESDRKWRIYVDDNWLDSANATAIAYGQSPAWSPDGLIAYRGCDQSGNSCGIYLMRSDGAQVSRLTDDASDDMPAWSGDGSQLAFASPRSGQWAVWVLDVESGKQTMLTDGQSMAVAPVWSPDGSSIAYLANTGGQWGIWVVAAVGGEPTLVVT